MSKRLARRAQAFQFLEHIGLDEFAAGGHVIRGGRFRGQRERGCGAVEANHFARTALRGQNAEAAV